MQLRAICLLTTPPACRYTAAEGGDFDSVCIWSAPVKNKGVIMSQRVLVTAGASGIGREIVRAFVANGAKVFVCDIDGKGLELLAQELPGLTTKICDVSNCQDIERMVAFGVD